MSKGSASKTMVWILMGLLIFGLGGFGITNLSGTVRTVGDVGGKEIDINEYARALQQELNALGAQVGRSVSFAEAQAAGVDSLVLGNIVTRRAMDAENARMGVSIGDENLREQLLQIPEFQNANGTFNRNAYSYAIDQSGVNEATFEDAIREDTARTLLQAAIVSGVLMPDSYGDTLMNFIAEQRNIQLARLSEDMLISPVGEPSDADLTTHYEANIAEFTLPAMRQITYAWLTPAMLIDTIELEEATLREIYDERGDEFNRPERRLVERLAFADQASAEAARAQLDSGETTFEALVEQRGLSLVDVDMGDVSAASLGPAGEIVFAEPVGAIAGPAQSDLGPAIFRINGVLPALETSFDDALPQLREELAAERARRVIDAQISDIDDLLAAGATLEELDAETEMELGQIGWHEGASDGIAGYETFRSMATILAEGDFPQIETLADGGIFAMRLDGETDATPAPFDEVREDVAQSWRDAQVVKSLETMAEGQVAGLKNGVEFAALGLTAEAHPGLMRSGFVADTPDNFLVRVFEMQADDIITLPSADGLLIVKLDSIVAPDLDNPEVADLRNVVLQQSAQGLSQDIFEAYAQDIQFVQGVTLNQQALNAVHAQFQ